MTKVIPFDARLAAHRRIDVAGDRAAAVMARLDKPMPQPRVPVFLRSVAVQGGDRPARRAGPRRGGRAAQARALALGGGRPAAPGLRALGAYRRNMQRLIGGES